MTKKMKPLSVEESNWFFQWWPDIRKTLVGAIFSMIGIGIVTLVTLVFTTDKMKEDFSKMENKFSSMEATIKKMDSTNIVNHSNRMAKDSMISVLMTQNNELIKIVTNQ